MRCISTYGLETELAFDCGLSCCWVKPNDYYIQKVKDLGFNCIRLPFSAEYINRGNLSLMDGVINKAEELGLEVVLDYHRTWSGHQGDWGETNFQDFINVWHRVLYQYYDKPNVGWVDLFNEYQQPNTPENVAFWNDLMSRSILVLENLFPGRFRYFVGGTNWGGNLHGIKVDVGEELDKRVYYTIHKYQWSISGSDYLHDYEQSFGGYSGDKLFIGEFGWIQSNEQQREWGKMFLDYLKDKKGVRKTALWCLSFYSSDTQGMLKPNCLDVEEEKLQMLRKFWGEDPHLRGLVAVPKNDTEVVLDIAGDDEDDWTDDWSEDEKETERNGSKQQVRVGWDDGSGRPRRKRRRCSEFHDEHERCERHRVCCYRSDGVCFKCL